jgi:hypothetical protein
MDEVVESPLLKDYRGDLKQIVFDMAEVCDEVMDFLKRRYGESYRVGNMVIFLQLLTASLLLFNGISVDKYVAGLTTFYEFLEHIGWPKKK